MDSDELEPALKEVALQKDILKVHIEALILVTDKLRDTAAIIGPLSPSMRIALEVASNIVGGAATLHAVSLPYPPPSLPPVRRLHVVK